MGPNILDRHTRTEFEGVTGTQVFSIHSKFPLLTSFIQSQTSFQLHHLQFAPADTSSWNALFPSSLKTYSLQGTLQMLPLKTYLSRFLFLQLQMDTPFPFSFVNLYSTRACFFRIITLSCRGSLPKEWGPVFFLLLTQEVNAQGLPWWSSGSDLMLSLWEMGDEGLCGGMSSIPSWGTRIPHTAQCSQKKGGGWECPALLTRLVVIFPSNHVIFLPKEWQAMAHPLRPIKYFFFLLCAAFVSIPSKDDLYASFNTFTWHILLLHKAKILLADSCQCVTKPTTVL